jgi:hypothetical protein
VELRKMSVDHVPRDESLLYLIYLYLWPFWMFKDANTGSLYERAAAYRHNRAKRAYLLGYIVKWSAIFILSLAAISVLESMGDAYSAWKLSLTMLAVGAAILATWALVVIMVMTVAYLFLTYWEY